MKKIEYTIPEGQDAVHVLKAIQILNMYRELIPRINAVRWWEFSEKRLIALELDTLQKLSLRYAADVDPG